MVSESALGFIQIGREIRARELGEDMFALIFGTVSKGYSVSATLTYGTPIMADFIRKPSGHSLSSIRRFKGLT